MKRLLGVVLGITLAATVAVAKESREEDRVQASGQVLEEILNIPDDIPKDLLDKAECVVVIPGTKKFAIGIGGSFGRGVMTCRSGANYTGPWSAPALYAVEGANIGLQLGGQETDFVLLVMNPKGVDSLLRSKVKLGADASAAAGPKGRDATAVAKSCLIRGRGACLRASRWKARRCGKTAVPTVNFTART